MRVLLLLGVVDFVLLVNFLVEVHWLMLLLVVVVLIVVVLLVVVYKIIKIEKGQDYYRSCYCNHSFCLYFNLKIFVHYLSPPFTNRGD